MPRELGDVLHWFLDEPPRRRAPAGPGGFALAVGAKDVLRAAFAWNLAAALAERAPGTTLVTRAPPGGGLRWPRAGPARLVPVADIDASRLAAAARREADRGAPVLTCVPPDVLGPEAASAPPGARALVFANPDEIDTGAALRLLEALLATWPGLAVGAVIHGATAIAAARRAFDRLEAVCEARLGRPLASYGLLLDDLDVYRSVVEGLPLVESRPEGRAARALRDVAGWMHRDLEEEEGGWRPTS